MRYLQSVSCVALAVAGALASPVAHAQVVPTTGAPITISPSSANVLNLLAPYLSLNATSVGQTTLSTSLSQAIAINNGASPTLQALGESDENLLGGLSTTLRTTPVGGTSTTAFGVAANLGGGLPNQAVPAGGTIAPSQAVGGLGAVLGAAYANGINASTVANTGPLSSVATLLNNAYTNFTSVNLGVAKSYFANGAANNSVTYAADQRTVATATINPAVAPAGYTLPTFNGLPNTTTSVYDNAYGVTNKQAGQDVFGSSRPDQVSTKINSFDPTALNQLAGNPSFPSGHTTYAYTDSILLAMLVPQEYQSMLYRGSAYANSRIVVGVHYPIDIIGSRALASYDLAQALSNPLYINNATTTGTAVNLPANFTAAQAQITPYLNNAATAAGCGTSVATCANTAANTANDPYAVSAAAAATYTSNLTYGLPTLTFAQAPREAAPAGGPDASILLAPIYGGTTAASGVIAPNGGINGTLSTTTINQIIVNTETTALAAFYGTSLSYWTRIDLASAAGYFSGVTGTLSLQPTDVVTTNVTIASGGTLAANGRVTGATTVQSKGTLAGSGNVANVTVAAGGILAPGSLAAQTALQAGTTNVAGTRLAVNGNLALQPGATLAVFVTPTQSTGVAATGTATIAGSNLQVTQARGRYSLTTDYAILTAGGGVTGTFASTKSSLPFLSPLLTYAPNSITLSFAPNTNALNTTAENSNERNLANALGNAARLDPNSQVVRALFNLQSAGEARAALNSLSGEGITAAQNVAQRSAQLFTSSILDQTTFFGPDGGGNSITLVAPLRELADLPTRGAIPVPPIVPERTWRAWATGFGGVEDIRGNSALGSAAQQNSMFGGTIGVDNQLSPNFLLGVAVGGTDGEFSVPGRSTSGSTTGGHVALYDLATFGRYYTTATASFSYFTNKTTRTAGGFGGLGSETEHGNFDSYEFRTHLEAGRHFDGSLNGITVTPFAAIEVADLHSNGFGETTVSGPGLLRLNVQDQSAASVPTFIGARFQRATNFGGLALTPTLLAAWVHEFAPYRSQTAGIADLPGATFLVDGARPARDAAQVKAGGELSLSPSSVLFATFDGEFSGVNQLYAGKGGFRFTW